ncbi:MAG: SAM-dependent chlorinase/fluorinase [Acidobacteria bacterium]|nr:SAM-dependent chlorinase/fluorinase [Acidobacteriota bacterium]
MRANGIITLTTDFGSADFFTGAMKGALLAVHPEARIVDLCHEVPAQQIISAGAILADALDAFPDGTVHVAVVDPGVGTARRAVAARTSRSFFVGPDNGIFTEAFLAEPCRELVMLDRPHYFRSRVSPTFHGRDVFAPAAGWISKGEPLSAMGTPMESAQVLAGIEPVRIEGDRVEGRIVHIDRFGNLLLNLKRDWMVREGLAGIDAVVLGDWRIDLHAEYFAAMEASPGHPFHYFGGAGRLEIAIQNRSAAGQMSARVGQAALIQCRR